MNLLRPGTIDALEAIITADIAGRVVFWSRGAGRIFGYTQAEIVGQPLTVLMPENYRLAHEAGIARVQRERVSRLEGQTLRLEGLRKNGQTFPMELTLATWFSSDQSYVTGIVRDLTESDVAQRLYQEIFVDVTRILTASRDFKDAAGPLLQTLS
jgi:PAS domain S-box-containing protein